MASVKGNFYALVQWMHILKAKGAQLKITLNKNTKSWDLGRRLSQAFVRAIRDIFRMPTFSECLWTQRFFLSLHYLHQPELSASCVPTAPFSSELRQKLHTPSSRCFFCLVFKNCTVCISKKGFSILREHWGLELYNAAAWTVHREGFPGVH